MHRGAFRDREWAVLEEKDEALVESAIAVAKALAKAIDAGDVAVSGPMVVRKLKGLARAMKRDLEDAVGDVADADLDVDTVNRPPKRAAPPAEAEEGTP